MTRLENLLYPVLDNAPETGRGDLVAVLLTGVPGLNFTGKTQADLIRLNTGIAADRRRRHGQPARRARRRLRGLPERPPARGGRRDRHRAARARVRLRPIVGPIIESFGFCAGNANRSPNNLLGDGVDTNDRPFRVVPVRGDAAPGLRVRPPRAPWAGRRAAGRGERCRSTRSSDDPAPSQDGGSAAAARRPARRRAPARRPGPRERPGVGPRRRPLEAASPRATPSLVARLQRMRASPATSARSRSSGSPTSSARARRPTDYVRQGRARAARPELAPRDALALSGSALALAQHRFREALALGRRARSARADTARHLGVVGDALLELGRYDEAFARSTAWSRCGRPRLVRARLLRARAARRPRRRDRGDGARARRGRRRPEPTAWTRVELGKLHFGRGALAGARSATTAPRWRVFPGYVYALDGLARRRGGARPSGARSRSPRAVGRRAAAAVRRHARRPLSRLGRDRPRREQYAARRRDRAPAARERRPHRPRDRALRRRPRPAPPRRARARAARARERPSIEADDVLGWALARNGRCGEALRSRSALRLGTRDAPKFFHRGMIERCLGRRAAARAGSAARSRSTRTSRSLGARRQEVRDREAPPRSSARLSLALGRPAGRRRRTRSATSPSTATRRIEVSGDRVYVHYVLDLAEIPTFQAQERPARSRRYGFARDAVSPAARARSTASGARCALALAALVVPPGAPAGLRRRASSSSTRPSPGARRSARLPPTELRPGRIGWREIVVTRRARRARSSLRRPARAERRAARLPDDLLASPLDVSRARARYVPGPPAGAPAPRLRAGTRRRRGVERLRGARRRRPRRSASCSSRSLSRSSGARRTRSTPGPRQGDRRRLPRRHPGTRSARVPARRDRDRHAHDRRLRARSRDARALGVRRPRAALPVAEPRLGAARRRRRRRRAARPRLHTATRTASAPPPPPPPPPRPRTRALAPAGRCSGSPSDLRRHPPVPDRARRPARRDLAAPVGYGLVLIVAFSLGLAATDHRDRPGRRDSRARRSRA